MKILNQIGRKEWSPDQVQKYVGNYEKVYFSYAHDEAVRKGAASGGSTTALLIYLLEKGEIDGALVLATDVIDGQVSCRFFIAKTREELLGARGSKYMAVYFTRDALPLIRDFQGKLAAVLLPCDATTLKLISQKDQAIADKVKYVFALVCGHNSEPALTQKIIEDVRKEGGNNHGKLINYSYRTGHWRGHLTVSYEDGTEIQKPFRYFSDYRNVYFYAQKKCHACYDHFGYNCDISTGDVWSLYLKDAPIKHTALICRSEKGETLIQNAVRDGALHCEEQDIKEILDGQSRTLPFHYNVSSRAKVSGLFGKRINDRVNETVKWHDYLVALIAMSNSSLTDKEWGRWVVQRIPRPLLRLYVFAFKGLELF